MTTPMQRFPLTRRALLTAIAALAAVPARADGADAAGFIQKLLHDLTDVVNGPGSTEEKRVALEKIIDSTVDLNSVSKFCLGRYWRTATDAQRRDYTVQFHHVLVASIARNVGRYKGVSFTIGRTAQRDDDFVVATTVTRPGEAPYKAEWLVSTAGGSPKLIDAVAEGVSLRLTQRADYASYLERNNSNIQALIDAMRQQAENPQG
jgi:phospholipid transport system substrate-binding protein